MQCQYDKTKKNLFIMSQDEILNYNKMCAEFLGICQGYFKSELDCSTLEYQWMCASANCTYEMQKDEFPLLNVYDYLKFHSDWNWIMEVIKAIEKLEFCVCIQYTYIGFGKKDYENTFLNYSFSSLTTKKDAVVYGINQFLIWYNNNK